MEVIRHIRFDRAAIKKKRIIVRRKSVVDGGNERGDLEMFDPGARPVLKCNPFNIRGRRKSVTWAPEVNQNGNRARDTDYTIRVRPFGCYVLIKRNRIFDEAAIKAKKSKESTPLLPSNLRLAPSSKMVGTE